MALYPVFLDLTGGKVLVAGAGSVGQRKVATLLTTELAEIVVLDTNAAAFACEDPRVCFARRAVMAEDIRDCVLVFAATSDAAENARIAALAASMRVPCNVADDPRASSFHVPAQAIAGDIQVAVATGGHSPALARRLRMEIEATLIGRYAALAALMGRLRPLVLQQGQETAVNSALFRAVVDSPLAELMAQGDAARARACLCDKLPPALHGHIEDLLHELC